MHSHLIDEITASFLSTAVETEMCRGEVPGCTSGEDCDSPLSHYGFTVDKFASESQAKAREYVSRFVERASEQIDRYPADEVGYDLWMTQAGHGVGFWDGDYETVPGDGKAMTNAVHAVGRDMYVYIGVDGELYLP